MPDRQPIQSSSASTSESDVDWQAKVGESLLRQAMRDGEWLILAGYVRALRARGVDVQPLYDRARLGYPSAPTLDELDRKVDAALAREEASTPVSYDSRLM